MSEMEGCAGNPEVKKSDFKEAAAGML